MDKEQLDNLRHSCAHLLAAAVMELYPNAKRTIGPSIENGFYFDFDFGDTKVSDEVLPKIEKRMKKILTSWKGFERHELSADDAKKEYPGNEFKHELIDEFSGEGQTLTFYKSGSYWDLCRGGHCDEPNKALINFKLLSVAGAYWRGDEKNKMLTRIYGTCFSSKKELEEHLNMLEEAKKRDHRKLGKSLDLFTFSEMVGPGLPLWTPKGTLLRNTLDEFVWEMREKRGYERVEIPHITKKDLYETSGHWEKFSDELFRITTREGHEFAMKPMNCPHHTQIYARRSWSYKELPQRYANTTTCYRDEQTGELHGLSRVRAFTQDDAHVFCRESQVKEEFLKIWDIIDQFYSTVGFSNLDVRLSLHDPENFESYLGSPELWSTAEQALRNIAEERGVEAKEEVGEAAFYGPKVDFVAKDSIGRQWQVATIQLDINMPERFDLVCTNEGGKDERIVMIHAAIMGSIERFLSIYIEHTAGMFPLWLSPLQVVLAPVGEAHIDFAEQKAEVLRSAGIRTHVDKSDETIGKKIRNAQMKKIPYTVVLGDKEVQGGQWQIRVRGEEQQPQIDESEFIEKIAQRIIDKEENISL